MELQEIYSKLGAIREEIFRGRIKSFGFGEHKSPASGQGIDFKEIRKWGPREPLRNVNWSLSMASWPTRAYAVDKIEPRDAPLILAVDVTPSILLQISEGVNKSRLLLELIGMLGLSAEYLKDPVGICYFSDKVEAYFRPKIGRANVFNSVKLIFDKVAELESALKNKRLPGIGKQTDVNKAIYFISARIKRQCSVVIISDFSNVINGESKLDFQSIQSLATRYSWNVIAIFLDDPKEFNWNRAGGMVSIEDVESGKHHIIKARNAKKIRSRFVIRREQLRKELQDYGINSAVLSYGNHLTDLAGFLRQRKSRVH